ncbi:alternative ribosome rescue aminoacyl-tRNA hydrolase ArfB [Flagellimonas allohymeniacidonis]|uniref:Aminoacyl-tRNA hydrolase n=1 Tax=Flagellimonas allohymeniacidonis TaxID=2517819 RepID=A0A4Q8QER2_9FLAO|nr:alternative ribosome rescue aminoacyl-tRNA hydrolase ArfB [Allomuricauda hymeniacidonis]TAI47668.1 aminoacyl-tRNA hydrolase [Allomuricauda hymeniacidonis]
MNKEIIVKELVFKAIRSSGPGGQHANKVASKVELTFNVSQSQGFSNSEKERLYLKLRPRLNLEGVLKLQCEESRSQHKNKQLVTQRFFEMIKKALEVRKKRKPTKPSKSSVEKRLKSKKMQSEKKAGRKKFDTD